MLINIKYLIEKYNVQINGIIHVGAHDGGETKDYNEVNVKRLIYFEPNKEIYKKLTENIKNYKNIDITTYNYALGESNKKENFYLSNNDGLSSSILKPKVHLQIHPEVQFLTSEIIDIYKLDDVDFDRKLYNFLNMDVQGYELNVLNGASKTLESVDYVYSEVNRDYVYENNGLITEIDDYLLSFGFRRVETVWWDNSYPWGDAFYIK